MKTQSQIRIASRALLAVLCLTLAVSSASAQVDLYGTGPVNGTGGSWQISGGDVVSDSFTLSSSGTVTGFSFGEYWVTGDPTLTVHWSITSYEDWGTAYAAGISNVANTSSSNLKNNLTIGTGAGTISDVHLSAGTYWLNLNSATTAGGDPVYWDENSGVGCGSSGCPSSASGSAVGTIPSESFTILGSGGGSTPEPSSLALFGSGILGLGGLLRKRFLG
jgi:PEP-CTERM motif-containing protein